MWFRQVAQVFYNLIRLNLEVAQHLLHKVLWNHKERKRIVLHLRLIRRRTLYLGDMGNALVRILNKFCN
ncbi:hypothetical protein QVD17_07231 [Tagetes erecta]|uniref:Uncharacterized protein n=1 Tax=Tagetes erecta TaxID=13708 RepID=A0AAD8LLS0_TARER|nr:hypothetical protein QVD17_07231 [Tagetes erecta]